MTMARSRSYWTNRRHAEREWQEQQLADDKKFNQLLEQQYTRLATDLSKEIERQVYSLASRNKQPYAEALKAVNAAEIADYEDLAKQVVEQANKMRAEGKTPSYADWSDDVNQRLRTYNATMRINRMEYIKSEIGIRLTENTMSIADHLRIKLTDNYRDEVLRQSGILGMSLQNAKAWVNNHTIDTVMKQVAGGNWSQRLWADQDALKARLDQVLVTGLINGGNPREMARKLKDNVSKTVKNQRSVTERLARTESARVQFQAQKQMIKENGFKYVEWFAEPSACAECKAIANKETSHGVGIYNIKFVPEIPDSTHPNCRCAIGAYYSDEMLDQKLEELGFGKEQAKKAKENAKAVNELLPDAIKGKLTDKQFAEVRKLLDKAPEYIKNLYRKYGDLLRVSPIDSPKGSYYSSYEKQVTFNMKDMLAQDTSDRVKYNSFFHEFGHMIDDLSKNGVSRNIEGGYTSAIPKYGLGISLKDNWDDYNLKLGSRYKTIADLDPKRVSKGWNSTTDYYAGTVRIKLKKNGQLSKVTQRQIGEIEHVDELMAEIKENGWQNYTDISDMVQALTNSRYKDRLFWGHSKSYFSQYGKQETEFFAETTAAEVTNPGSLAVIKKHFPDAYKAYRQMVDEIGKE